MTTTAEILELFAEEAPSVVDRRDLRRETQSFCISTPFVTTRTKQRAFNREAREAMGGFVVRTCRGCGVPILVPYLAIGSNRRHCTKRCGERWTMRVLRERASRSPLRSETSRKVCAALAARGKR